MSLQSNLHTVWSWLTDDKNQKTLMFVGGGLLAVVTALSQLGVFEIKPSVVVDHKTARPISAVPAPAASTPVAASAAADPSVKQLLEAIAQKDKTDQAEREYRQEREAWQLAQQLNTIAGFQAYLSDYPNGRHAHFAEASIDKLRSPVSNLTASSTAQATPKPATPAPHKNAPHAAKPVASSHTQASGKPRSSGKPARIVVQCMEGTRLYVDGVERGRITTNLFGTFAVNIPPGKHALLLANSLGVLQQDVELSSGKTLRLSPQFCGN